MIRAYILQLFHDVRQQEGKDGWGATNFPISNLADARRYRDECAIAFKAEHMRILRVIVDDENPVRDEEAT